MHRNKSKIREVITIRDIINSDHFRSTKAIKDTFGLSFRRTANCNLYTEQTSSGEACHMFKGYTEYCVASALEIIVPSRLTTAEINCLHSFHQINDRWRVI
jgi:hypothetical protein